MKSLKDTSTMGGYGTAASPNSGVPGTIYTSRAGFVDLGHLFAVANVTGWAYQKIYAAKGTPGAAIATPHGFAILTSMAAPGDWLELARMIAYDDSVAYEIQTFKGTGWNPKNQWWAPGSLNSAFSPEDLCSNYLGTVVAASALNSAFSQRVPMSFGANVDHEVRQLLLTLGAVSVTEARKALKLKDGRWIDTSAWLPGIVAGAASTMLPGANPFYLKRRNFTWNPWLAGLPTDRPGWAPTPFRLSGGYEYKHSSGFSNKDFSKEIEAIRPWLAAKFGPNYDQP
jgi:hypothetical protein